MPQTPLMAEMAFRQMGNHLLKPRTGASKPRTNVSKPKSKNVEVAASITLPASTDAMQKDQTPTTLKVLYFF